LAASLEIAALAQEVFRRRVDPAPPPTLVLGIGVAKAAGMPSYAEMAKAITPDLPADEQRVSALRGWLAKAAPVDRAIAAAHLTGTIPIPQFAQELALLARDGFFGAIVTRSFNALLERALELAGVIDEEGYQVVDLLDGDFERDSRRLTIVKAYGERIDRTPALEPLLDGMVIVLGAGEEDMELTQALAHHGGPLWWVDREPPLARAQETYEAGREVRQITGTCGEPDRFFGELSLFLQQIPSVNVARMPREAADKSWALIRDRSGGTQPGHESRLVVAALGSIGGVAPEYGTPEEFERLLLRTRYQRCRDAIRRLRRRGGGMAIDEAVDRQLAYQKKLLDRLEILLRTHELTKATLFELLDAVRQASADSDPTTAKFLDTLVERIGDEYAHDEPNQQIVGATLGAVTILAAQAGVAPELVERLSAFAPDTGRAAL
jgi:hypothetical protein